MFSLGIDEVLWQLGVCSWLMLTIKMRVKGLLIVHTGDFSLFVNCELSSASPPPLVLDHKLKFSLVSCLSKSREHLGGMHYSPSSLLASSWLADINYPYRQEILKCQMPESGTEFTMLIWTERAKFSSWKAICKLFWMTKPIHSFCKIACFFIGLSQAQLWMHMEEVIWEQNCSLLGVFHVKFFAWSGSSLFCTS